MPRVPASLEPALLFRTLNAFDEIAVAVSGGGDSLALLLLLAEWTSARGKKLSVMTVDHGLREAALGEALYVGSFCRRLGVSHRILSWDGSKPVSGLANAARAARYELMAAHCAHRGVKALVLGHTRDDQAETVLMRLRRKAGGNRGLSGMAGETLFSPSPLVAVKLFRPLLGVSRADLRLFLSQENVRWVDDPTNEDMSYERVRVRHMLTAAPSFREELISYSGILSRDRGALAAAVAAFIAQYCRATAFDCVTVERCGLDRAPRSVAVLAVQALLSVLGGRDYLPPAEKVLAMLEERRPTTLARTHARWSALHLVMHREVRGLPLPFPLQEEPSLWDGRFWISRGAGAPERVEVRAGADLVAADAGFMQACSGFSPGAMTKFDRAAFCAMPIGRFYDTSFQYDDLMLLPERVRGKIALSRALGAFERYCPGFDLAIRAALAGLFTVTGGNR